MVEESINLMRLEMTKFTKYSGFGLSQSCKMSAIYFYLWQLLVRSTLRNIKVLKVLFNLTLLQ